MANWCDTRYTLMGDKQELDAVYELMYGLETMEKPRVENDFGNTFLGCLVDMLGGDWENASCRGEWGDLKRLDDRITFCTSTAWAPLNEVWDMLCKRYPSVRYYYYAEEPGCNIYETNDATGLYYPNRFKAEYSSSFDRAAGFPGVEAYFTTRDEAMAWIKERLGIDFSSSDEREKLLKIYGIDIAIHPINIITHEQDLLCRAIVKSAKFDYSDGNVNITCDLSNSGLPDETIQELI